MNRRFTLRFLVIVSIPLLITSCFWEWKWSILESDLVIFESNGTVIKNELYIPGPSLSYDIKLVNKNASSVPYRLSSNVEWISSGEKEGTLNGERTVRLLLNRSGLQEGRSTGKLTIEAGKEKRIIEVIIENSSNIQVSPSEIIFGTSTESKILSIWSENSKAHVLVSCDAPWLVIKKGDSEFDIPSYDKSDPSTVRTIELSVDRNELQQNSEAIIYVTTASSKDSPREVRVSADILNNPTSLVQSIDGLEFSIDKIETNKNSISITYGLFYSPTNGRQSIDLQLSADCVYDNLGRYGYLSWNKYSSNNGSGTTTVISNGVSFNTTIKKGEKGTGTFTLLFDDDSFSGIQYLRIGSNLSDNFVFRKIILPDRNYREPPSIDTPIWNKEGTIIGLTKIEENDTKSTLYFAFISDHEASKVAIDPTDITLIDNLSIIYNANQVLLGGIELSKNSNFTIPDNVYIQATVSAPRIDIFAFKILDLNLPYVRNTEKYTIELHDIMIDGREDLSDSFETKGVNDGVDFIMMQTKEDKQNIIVDYLLRNNNSNSRIIDPTSYSSSSRCFLYDDLGGQYPYSNELLGVSSYLNKQLLPNESIHGRITIEGFNSIASKISYLNYMLRKLGNNEDVVYAIRDLSIIGRIQPELPQPMASAKVVSTPSGISILPISCKRLESGTILMTFNAFNTNPIDTQKKLTIGLGTNYDGKPRSFAYFDNNPEKTCPVTGIKVGMNKNNEYFAETTIPGQILCNCEVLISGIPNDVKQIDYLFLDLYNNDNAIIINDIAIAN